MATFHWHNPNVNVGMVKITQKENQELYQCEECGFHYREKELAERCESWCREHKSCSLEITAYAEESKTIVENGGRG